MFIVFEESYRCAKRPFSYSTTKCAESCARSCRSDLLDRPQLDTSIPLDDPASQVEALNEAREGTVLLKNERNILPLDRKRIRSIAVLGSAA